MDDRLQIEVLLDRYAAALHSLETEAPKYSQPRILEVIAVRNAVRQLLGDRDASHVPVELLHRLLDLDDRLRLHSGAIADRVNLNHWRDSFEPSEPWWWRFEKPAHPRDRWDWFWNGLTIACLTASVSIIAELGSRFLDGNPDLFGVLAIAAPSVMTLLAGGGTLTQAGRDVMDSTLVRLGVPPHWWNETKFALAALLLILLMIFYSLLPQIAKLYDEVGLQRWKQGDFSTAEMRYERALKLNPDDARTRFHMARLYEDLGNLEQAQADYQLAIEAGNRDAYAYLARLLILNDQPAQVVQLLLPQEDWILDEAQDPELRYAIAKYLGWARYQQARYAEAKAYLQAAVEIARSNNLTEMGASYCLLAETLDAQNSAAAPQEWQNCLENSSPTVSPEEDAWIATARKRMAAKTP